MPSSPATPFFDIRKMAAWTVPVILCAFTWLSLLRPVLGQDTNSTTTTPHPANGNKLTESERVAAITVPCVIGGIILIAILVFIILKVRERRQTEGTYHPSSEEQVGSRVDTSNALKLPPEERLI